MQIKLQTLLALSLILIPFQSQAQDSLEFRIGKTKIEFTRDFATGTTISNNCFKEGKLDCDASNSLNKVSLKKLGGMQGEPGAKICTSQLHAELIMGLDENDIECSFCRFKDGSLVTTGTIYFHAMGNDKL